MTSGLEPGRGAAQAQSSSSITLQKTFDEDLAIQSLYQNVEKSKQHENLASTRSSASTQPVSALEQAPAVQMMLQALKAESQPAQDLVDPSSLRSYEAPQLNLLPGLVDLRRQKK